MIFRRSRQRRSKPEDGTATPLLYRKKGNGCYSNAATASNGTVFLKISTSNGCKARKGMRSREPHPMQIPLFLFSRNLVPSIASNHQRLEDGRTPMLAIAFQFHYAPCVA